jgi:hypothetical protein
MGSKILILDGDSALLDSLRHNLLLILAFLIKEGYTMIHETKRKCRSAGSAKTTSGNATCERFGHSGSSPAGRGITILGDTLE